MFVAYTEIVVLAVSKMPFFSTPIPRMRTVDGRSIFVDIPGTLCFVKVWFKKGTVKRISEGLLQVT
jgi:hypothetical protein